MNSLAIAASFAFAAFSQAQPTGSIEGQLVNRNTGTPLNKAVLTLELPSAHDPPAASETDEQGRFRFTHLKPGRYELSAQRRGFLRQKYGAGKFASTSKPIAVSAGQEVRDIVFNLSPESVISGRVFDEDGEPVEGAEVAVLKTSWSGGYRHWEEEASAISLDNGEYRIPKLVPGQFIIRCTPPKLPSDLARDTAYVTTFYPNAVDQAMATPVEAGSANETGGLDIRLKHTRVFYVHGRLIIPSGGTMAPAYVALVDRENPTRVIAGAGPAPPDFLLDIPRVPPGVYLAAAWWQGGTSTRFTATQPVEVTGSDVTGLVLNLAPLTEIRGTVKLENASTPVSLRAIGVGTHPMDVPGGSNGSQDVPRGGTEWIPGAPLEVRVAADAGGVDGTTAPGATVALIANDGKPAMDAIADDQGAFQFPSVPPGDYRLLAWEDVERGAYQDSEFLKPFESRATAVKVSPGKRATVQIKAIPAE